MNFSIDVLIETILIVATAVPRVMLLAAIIVVMGIILGGLLTIIRRKQIPVLTQVIEIVMSYMRGVPLIVHLFIIRYALPGLSSSFLSLFGVTTDPADFPSVAMVLVAFTLLELTVESENIRGAFASIGKDQFDAAYSIGMTNKQTYQQIIIPQALSVAIPLFLNAYIKNIKALSLAFTVGVVDILTQARFAAALSYRYLESYVAAAIVYWIICGLLQLLFDYMEKKIRYE